MSDKSADLHVHTNFSDSTLSPEEVIKTAAAKHLSCIAVTDHDSVAAVPLCMEYAKNYGIEIIPGIEMTVEKENKEVHILGYFIDWQAEWFKEKIKHIQDSRVGRIYRMIELLKNEGIDISPDDVFKIAGCGSVGRLHLATAMYKAKKIKSLKEAFQKYIGFLKPCYVSHIKFSPEEAIGLILKAKGIPVLAHPGLMGNDGYIDELIETGLKGLEVFHTDHNPSQTRKYRKIAEEKGLLITGGSDCHGMGKGRVLMGTVKLEYRYVEELKGFINLRG